MEINKSVTANRKRLCGSNKRIVVEDTPYENRVGMMMRKRWMMNHANNSARMPAICNSSQSLQSISVKLSRSGSGDPYESHGFSGIFPAGDFSYSLPMSAFGTKKMKCIQADDKSEEENKEIGVGLSNSSIHNGSSVSIKIEPLPNPPSSIIDPFQINKDSSNLSMDPKSKSVSKALLQKQVTIKQQQNNECLFERLGVSSDLSMGKGLALLFNIHRFVRAMKKKIGTHKFKEITKRQFELIGDRAASYNVYFFSRALAQIPTLMQHAMYRFEETLITLEKKSTFCVNTTKLFSSGRFIATPVNSIKYSVQILNETTEQNSSVSTIFNLLVLVSIMRILFSVPIFVSIESVTPSNFEGDMYPLLNIFTQLCFAFQILLKLNTAVYLRGEIVVSRRVIAKQYISSSNFTIDVVACVLMFYCSSVGFGYISLLLLVKLKELQAITQQLELKYQLKGKEQAFFELVKLILLILFIAHCIACGALYITKIESSSSRNWFSGMSNSEWYVIYTNAVYWSIVTMVTLGYGDIVPIQTTEKVYVIGVALVGCFVLSYSMTSIGDIVRGFARADKELKEKMHALNHYFSQRELQKDMQLRVIKYYQYLHSQQQEADDAGYKLIRQLPHRLKHEIMESLYLMLLTSKKLYALNFSKGFLQKISLKMQEEIFSPDQTIFIANTNPDRLYFLLSGQVEIYIDQTEKSRIKPIAVLRDKQDSLGEFEFFSGLVTETSARAQTVTNLAFITKSDFLQVLEEYPLDKERFKMMQDQCALLRSPRLGVVACFACKSYRHTLLECPYILFQSARERTIAEAQRSIPMIIRNSAKRRSNKGIKTLLFQVDIESAAYALQQTIQSCMKISLLDTSQQNIGFSETNRRLTPKHSLVHQPYSKQLSAFAKEKKKKTIVFKHEASPMHRRKERNDTLSTQNNQPKSVVLHPQVETITVVCTTADRIPAGGLVGVAGAVDMESDNNNHHNQSQTFGRSPVISSSPSAASFADLEGQKAHFSLLNSNNHNSNNNNSMMSNSGVAGSGRFSQMMQLFVQDEVPPPSLSMTSKGVQIHHHHKDSISIMNNNNNNNNSSNNQNNSININTNTVNSEEKTKTLAALSSHEDRRNSLMSMHQFAPIIEGTLTADYLLNRVPTRAQSKKMSLTSIDMTAGEGSPSMSIGKAFSAKGLFGNRHDQTQPFGFAGFEKAEEFSVYFPHNNRKVVLERLAIHTRSMRKSLKTSAKRASSRLAGKQKTKKKPRQTKQCKFDEANAVKTGGEGDLTDSLQTPCMTPLRASDVMLDQLDQGVTVGGLGLSQTLNGSNPHDSTRMPINNNNNRIHQLEDCINMDNPVDDGVEELVSFNFR